MTQWGVDTLFNPAKRHMDEEKRRLQSTRSEVGDNSGGKRIDLESGKVVIQKADDDADGPPDTPAPDAKAARGKNKSEKDLTPAQQRALKRRGKA